MKKLIKIIDMPNSETLEFYEIHPEYNTLYWERHFNDEVLLNSGHCVANTRDSAMQSVIDKFKNVA